MQDLKIEPIVEEQTCKAIAAANALTVSNEDTYKSAASALANVKAVSKMILARKEAITKPLNESLKSARELFRPFETDVAAAEVIIKRKMVTYHDELEAAARKKEAQLQARVERGTMKVDTAITKTAQIERVESKAGESYRKIRKMRITDLKKAPAQYFIVDEVRLRRDALAVGGIGEVMPGVEVYEESSLAL